MANILVIRSSAFGDVAMLVPVIYSAAKRYPQHVFYVLTSAPFAQLFDLNLDNVVAIKTNYKKEHRGISGFFRLLATINRFDIDYVADMHDVIRTKFIRQFFLLKGKEVAHIYKERDLKKDITSGKKKLRQLKATTNRYSDVLTKLGFPSEMTFTSLTEDVAPISQKELNSLRDKTAIDTTIKNIGIAPFAKHQGKIYPIDKMESVISKLSKEENTRLYIFGGKEEKDIVEEWVNKYPNIFCTIGILNLKEELSLISMLDVMVTMDSANMHLASLVATPVISIWGATHPFLGFYGYNQSLDNAIQIDNLDCRPCSVFGNKPCFRKDYACMNMIAPDIVVEKIVDYLQRCGN